MDAETEKMLGDGSLYDPNLPELAGVQMQCLEKLFDYNATRPGEAGKRAALLRGMFAEIGEDCYIEPPLRSNWGGRHVHFGSGIYANFNLTLVDDADIFVGDEVMFGPNVTLVTAAHPVDPGLRGRGTNTTSPSASAAGSGWGPARPFCPASPSARTRSSARGAWSQRTYPRTWWPSASRRGSSAPSARRTGSITGKAQKRIRSFSERCCARPACAGV